ncbi:MAG: TM1812 family CRISPR-associated protein [Bacteroidota bacterium]|nr:TM1812 family CRISPR-associated protein [Bacteroidota bacterium]
MTFIGIGEYQETTYRWVTQTHTTRYVAEALVRFFAPDRVFAVMTEEAVEKHGEPLAEAIGDFTVIDSHPATSEEGLWDTADGILREIPCDKPLIVDITHGFRSQPLIALACCAFLRTSKRLTVERIVYGAYEGRDESNVAPIVDCTSFLRLLDWSNAADIIIRYGDARPLRDIVAESVGKEPVKELRKLKAVAGTLEHLTAALALIRPAESLKAARQLARETQSGKPIDTMPPHLMPFAVILERSLGRYGSMCVPAGISIYARESLPAQAAIIEEYISTERYVQAVTLARESYLTWFCLDRGLNPADKNDRVTGQNLLSELLKKPRGRSGEKDRQIRYEWEQITSLRNDIDHAGMHWSAIRAGKAVERVKEVCALAIARLRS